MPCGVCVCYMDTDLKKEDAEGASSDEEEAFESADEGEEGMKSSKPPFATSAGNESSNSTSKELVGKNDRPTKPPVSFGDDTSSKTTEIEKQPPKMDQNVTQEKTGQETQAGGDALCRVPAENSPCSDEIGPDTEVYNKTLVEEHADNLSSNVSEDETKTIECKGDNDEEKSDRTEADKNEDDRGQDKSTASLIESGAEENTEVKDNEEQKQTSGNLDKEPLKHSVESSDSDKDVQPDR